MDWVSKHAHVIIAVVGGVGLTATAIAANTAGLLPSSVGAWIAATGAIVTYVVSHIAVPPLAQKLALRFKRS
jgi:uncharacterized membrane protein